MKIKLVLTAILFAGIQGINAQEIKSAIVIDSAKTNTVDLERQNASEKAQLELKLLEEKKALKIQEDLAKAKKDVEEAEKDREKAERL